MTSIELSGEPMHTCNEELEAKRPLSPEETTVIERYVFPRPLISDEQRRVRCHKDLAKLFIDVTIYA